MPPTRGEKGSIVIWQGVIFQHVGSAGWSEVFYLSAADVLSAMSLLQQLNTALLKTQCDAVFTDGLRVSDVQVKGDGFVAAPINNSGSLAIGAGSLADVNLAARYRLDTADNLHRVNHYVHGLRQVDVSGGPDGRTETTAVYATLADVIAFQTVLKNNTVNWQKRSIPPVTAGFSNCELIRPLSIRRVGRPFGLPRGRRRTV